MKNTFKYFFAAIALASTILVSGCEKDDTTDNLSKIVKVTYPGIKLNGDSTIVLLKGATYTDAGAVLTDDITGAKSDIKPLIDTVNVNRAGIYFVVFKAENSNGFITLTRRPVIVLDSAYNGTVDLSGVFKRTANDALINIKKVNSGVYVVDNVGGFAAPPFAPVILIQTTDTTFQIPLQDGPNALGDIECELEEIVDGGAKLKWKVVNASFFPSVRTFVRQ